MATGRTEPISGLLRSGQEKGQVMLHSIGYRQLGNFKMAKDKKTVAGVSQKQRRGIKACRQFPVEPTTMSVQTARPRCEGAQGSPDPGFRSA